LNDISVFLPSSVGFLASYVAGVMDALEDSWGCWLSSSRDGNDHESSSAAMDLETMLPGVGGGRRGDN
jgi:hypothetical protein